MSIFFNPSPGGQVDFFFLSGGTFNPANATKYYLSLDVGATLTGAPSTTPQTSGTTNAPTAQVPITITRIDLAVVVVGTLGSAQTGSMGIRINNSSEGTILTNLLWNAVVTGFLANNLTIQLNPGDFFQFWILDPTWVTLPTSVSYIMRVYGVTH